MDGCLGSKVGCRERKALLYSFILFVYMHVPRGYRSMDIYCGIDVQFNGISINQAMFHSCLLCQACAEDYVRFDQVGI